MDWARYKVLCDRPDYWSRWMLEQSSELFSSYGALELSRNTLSALDRDALERPADYAGPESLHMFQLHLSAEDAATALAIIARARSDKAKTSATGDRGLGGFVEAWQEYAQMNPIRPHA